MGQAKNRGKREDRVAQAIQRQKEQEPINVPCQTCKAILNGFSWSHSTAAGAFWQKTCSCGAITTALVQSENKSGSLDRTVRSSGRFINEIAKGEKSVSFSLIEKTLDSVETGIIRL